jgi:hypothetical protein
MQMHEARRPAASCLNHPLWVALANYEIGPKRAALTFQARLARENGWSEAHSARVIGEYKRFCFLAATCGHEVTPSDAVDQAWHLHLTYSRDYWERFCPEVLGRPLHHEPSQGGAASGHHFFERYAETLQSYERVFGECAPVDLWPNAARRLLQDPKARRFHPRDGFLVTRAKAGLIFLSVSVAFLALILLR